MKNKSLWSSFQGCVIAVMPLVVSTLVSIAAYKFFQRQTFPPFVVMATAVVVWMLVFVITYSIKQNLGEQDHEWE